MFASFARHERNATYGQIRPNEIQALDSTTRIVDVREPYEFTGDLGHIKGAELVPLATITAASRNWNRQDDIVVVCRSGGRSAKACEVLAGSGFGNVRNLVGGMIAYSQMGLPTE